MRESVLLTGHQQRVTLATVLLAGLPVGLLARKHSKPQGSFSIQSQSQLVNLTITATDSKGQPVKGLKASDVVVKDDGKPQTLLNFKPAVSPSNQQELVRSAGPPGRLPPRPRHTAAVSPDYIAFVMDDSTTRYVDLRQSILAAEKWVREDMTPFDRVGLFSISNGVKIWQPFTNDRDLLIQRLGAMLHETPAEDLNERTHDLIPELRCGPRMQPYEMYANATTSQKGNDPRGANDTAADRSADMADRWADMWAAEERPPLAAQISWLRALVDMLGVFPGHKRVMYLGDGFLMNPRLYAAYVYAAYCQAPINFGVSREPHTLHSVIDAATREGVTFYTIDARGLIADTAYGSAAENNPPPMSVSNNANVQALYREKLHAPQDPLNELAHDTGGIAYHNGNDLTYFIRRAVNSIEGTYYASYQPADIRLNGRYHQITIRSLRPGVKVRTRGGYYARPVREFSVRARVLKMEQRANAYDVRVKFILNPAELHWHGLGSHKHDELTIANRLEDSSEQLVSNRVYVLDLARPRSGPL
ncbi:MAG: VWA domain-containing protein, partial [Acidobacteria bacterium]|nr:VWA domain-containing protein [Acidobacteriota bacterium]